MICCFLIFNTLSLQNFKRGGISCNVSIHKMLLCDCKDRAILCRCKTLREEVLVATYQYIKCYFVTVKIVHLETREKFDTQTDLR